ncbi:hypothetical protein [Endozoicomonas lisbonensis]
MMGSSEQKNGAREKNQSNKESVKGNEKPTDEKPSDSRGRSNAGGDGKKPPDENKKLNSETSDTSKDLRPEIIKLLKDAITSGDYSSLIKFFNDNKEQLKAQLYTSTINDIRDSLSRQTDIEPSVISELPDIIRPDRQASLMPGRSTVQPRPDGQTMEQITESQEIPDPLELDSWEAIATLLFELNLQSSSLWAIIRETVEYCLDNRIPLPQLLEDVLWIAARGDHTALRYLINGYSQAFVSENPLRLLRTILYQFRNGSQIPHVADTQEYYWSLALYQKFNANVINRKTPQRSQPELAAAWSGIIEHLIFGLQEPDFDHYVRQLTNHGRNSFIHFLIHHATQLTSLSGRDPAGETSLYWLRHNNLEILRTTLQQRITLLLRDAVPGSSVIYNFQVIINWLTRELLALNDESRECYGWMAGSLPSEQLLALVVIIGRSEIIKPLLSELSDKERKNKTLACSRCKLYMDKVWQTEAGNLICEQCTGSFDRNTLFPDQFCRRMADDLRLQAQQHLHAVNACRLFDNEYRSFRELQVVTPVSMQVLLSILDRVPLPEQRGLIIRWLRLEFFDSPAHLNLLIGQLTSHGGLTGILDIIRQIQRDHPGWLARESRDL